MSRVVFATLFDDAAVFPPGNAPLTVAVTGHRALRAGGYAGLVGPLLVPAGAVTELTDLVTPDQPPLAVRLISRPGAPLATVLAALDTLAQERSIDVVGVESAWQPDWATETIGDLPIALEVPRGPDQARALAEVQAAHRQGRAVAAKFRTGPTPTWPWPDERELAGFLGAVVGRVPYKLTGGLHHAVRGRYVPAGGTLEDNHGVLNVLAATRAALLGHAETEIAATLAYSDPERLVDEIQGWSGETEAEVRAACVSIGCCTVTDPIGELTVLGLLLTPGDSRDDGL